MEQLEKVQTFVHSEMTASQPKHVLVNTEWGAFGDNGVLQQYRSKYDHSVDKKSINATKQLFEKMVSGMYLGELVRQIILDAAEKKILFNGQVSDRLQRQHSIDAKFLSKCEKDVGEYPYHTRQALYDMLGIENAIDIDCRAVRLICERVSTRSAHMIASALSLLVKRINMKKMAIGADGSVFQKHPHFNGRCLEMMNILLKHTQYVYTIENASDGSGVGAAIVAATHL